MVRRFGLIILLIISCLGILAQTPISRATNTMRSGDILNKLKVGYVDAGDAGQGKVWTLGQVTDDSEEYLQSIAAKGDTIAILEKGNILHYLMHGDTLYYKGHQQSRLYCLFDKEHPVMRYPFQYGDSISGCYEGRGIDENIGLSIQGWGYSVADGTGILTDGTDTLYNVLRVHFHDDYTETHFSADTVMVSFVGDRYAWFSTGCRYPVQESQSLSMADGDSLFVVSRQTFLFLPEAQKDLPYDSINDSILSTLSDASVSFSQTFPLNNFQAGISPSGNCLDLSFTLSEACNVSLVACDVIGNMLCSFCRTNCAQGDWQESITLSRRPFGNTLIINVKCNEQEMSFKTSK